MFEEFTDLCVVGAQFFSVDESLYCELGTYSCIRLALEGRPALHWLVSLPRRWGGMAGHCIVRWLSADLKWQNAALSIEISEKEEKGLWGAVQLLGPYWHWRGSKSRSIGQRIFGNRLNWWREVWTSAVSSTTSAPSIFTSFICPVVWTDAWVVRKLCWNYVTNAAGCPRSCTVAFFPEPYLKAKYARWTSIYPQWNVRDYIRITYSVAYKLLVAQCFDLFKMRFIRQLSELHEVSVGFGDCIGNCILSGKHVDFFKVQHYCTVLSTVMQPYLACNAAADRRNEGVLHTKSTSQSVALSNLSFVSPANL